MPSLCVLPYLCTKPTHIKYCHGLPGNRLSRKHECNHQQGFVDVNKYVQELLKLSKALNRRQRENHLLLIKTISAVTRLHYGQERKLEKRPYSIHLFRTSINVIKYGGNYKQAIAALLHDVIEDCAKHYPHKEIGLKQDLKKELNTPVFREIWKIVEECTDNRSQINKSTEFTKTADLNSYCHIDQIINKATEGDFEAIKICKWIKRKQQHASDLLKISEAALLVTLSDKLDNLTQVISEWCCGIT